MCQRMGFPPISTMGFGRRSVSSDNLEPRPPAKITTFISGTNEIKKIRNYNPSKNDKTLFTICVFRHFHGITIWERRAWPTQKTNHFPIDFFTLIVVGIFTSGWSDLSLVTWQMESTTSIPFTTWPKTVYLPSSLGRPFRF